VRISHASKKPRQCYPKRGDLKIQEIELQHVPVEEKQVDWPVNVLKHKKSLFLKAFNAKD